MTNVQFYANGSSEVNPDSGQEAKAVALSWVSTLISPAPGGRPGVQFPTLKFSVDAWNDQPMDLQVQVDNNSDFSSPVWTTTLFSVPGDGTEDTVNVGTALTFDTTYYWRVRAGDGVAWGAWTASRTMVPTAGASDAVEYVLGNVGVDLPQSREHGYEWVLSNVGVYLPESLDHGYEWVLFNVGVEVTLDSRAYESVLLGDVSTNVPTPHIWFLRPTSGRAGDGLAIIGSGFGDTQVELTGSVEVSYDFGNNWTPVPVVTWQTFPADPNMYGPLRLIQEYPEVVDPQHQEIEVVVPSGATPPGMLVRIKTDA